MTVAVVTGWNRCKKFGCTCWAYTINGYAMFFVWNIHEYGKALNENSRMYVLYVELSTHTTDRNIQNIELPRTHKYRLFCWTVYITWSHGSSIFFFFQSKYVELRICLLDWFQKCFNFWINCTTRIYIYNNAYQMVCVPYASSIICKFFSTFTFPYSHI